MRPAPVEVSVSNLEGSMNRERRTVTKHQRKLLRQRARAMRHEPTHTEWLLWSALRCASLGVTFRRQWVCPLPGRLGMPRYDDGVIHLRPASPLLSSPFRAPGTGGRNAWRSAVIR